MSTFVLIHGGGDVGWYWQLVEAELRAHGHDVVAPDLPTGGRTRVTKLPCGSKPHVMAARLATRILTSASITTCRMCWRKKR